MNASHFVLVILTSAVVSAGVAIGVNRLQLGVPEAPPPVAVAPAPAPPPPAPKSPAEPAPVDVPDIVGMTPEQARAALDPRGLLLVLDAEREDAQAPAGKIVVQAPLGASRVAPGTAIHASVAKAPATVAVPDVRGRSLSRARELATKAELTIGAVRYTFDEDRSDGVVLEQTPSPETQAAKASKIDVVVNRHD